MQYVFLRLLRGKRKEWKFIQSLCTWFINTGWPLQQKLHLKFNVWQKQVSNLQNCFNGHTQRERDSERDNERERDSKRKTQFKRHITKWLHQSSLLSNTTTQCNSLTFFIWLYLPVSPRFPLHITPWRFMLRVKAVPVQCDMTEAAEPVILFYFILVFIKWPGHSL